MSNRLVVLLRLGASYISAILQNWAYYLFGREPVRYANAVVLVNSQCNSRCSMCTSYTVKANPSDMTFEQLCSVLDKLKNTTLILRFLSLAANRFCVRIFMTSSCTAIGLELCILWYQTAYC